MGLAQLALKAFINLATKADIAQVDGTISSFDKVNLTKLRHIFTKFGFTIKLTDPQLVLAKSVVRCNDLFIQLMQCI